MCNCNQQRAQYSSGNNHAQKGLVKVKLISDSPMVVTGNITGRTYIFNYVNEINLVDARDSVSMKSVSDLLVLN